MLPSSLAARASWNYRREIGLYGEEALSVTYDMNRLQGLQTSEHYLVTLNSRAKIDERRVVKEIHYTHPLFSVAALKSQNAIAGLQGQSRTWYCGAYCGWGFHEDGAKAGLAVAKSLMDSPELSFS
jgi:predicted NAD/FAD-binding protein